MIKKSLALTLLLGTAFAADPAELTTLRQSWAKAREQATAPIDKKYSDALSQMKIRLTKAGDLEGALAVEAELQQLRPPQAATPKKETFRAAIVNSNQELQKVITGTKWKMTRVADNKKWGVWEFKADGTIEVNTPRKWTVKDKRTVAIDGYFARFSDDLKSFEVTWGESGNLRGEVETDP
jgi:hypothetical protein